MRARRNDGTELNAEFELTADGDGFALTLHSAGGKVTGSDLPRNSDYAEALRTLLTRLGSIGAVLTGALLDSARGRNLDVAARHVSLRDRAYPVALADVGDMEGLRLAITASLGDVARGAGTRKSGNNSKRVRLAVSLPAGHGMDAAALARVLTAAGGVVAPVAAGGVTSPAGTRRPGGGQGRQADPAVRKAVEECAMAAATAHYLQRGWTVTDVSRATAGTNPWDLTCGARRCCTWRSRGRPVWTSR
ncbi:hypothetical protein [Actinorhabdospora filicis]|nr:hypothetical protein [Actinorhabdospora filicis]